MDGDEMNNPYRGSAIDASYQISVQLAKRFQRRRFSRNQPIRNKNGLWRPCLLTDQDEMSNLYRGPSKDALYQVSIHLTKRFQRRRFFRNQPIRNKNGLWRPCLLTDRDEMSILYRGPAKFRFIWPSGFRGEDFLKSANRKQELPMVTMFVDGLGQNEQSLERTFHRRFLPSFTSFG
jgi:hypothetical protein